MRQTDAAGGAVEIGDVALEPDRAALALAHAERLARRLLLKPVHPRRGRIIDPAYPVGPAPIYAIALYRLHPSPRLLPPTLSPHRYFRSSSCLSRFFYFFSFSFFSFSFYTNSF